MEVLANVFPTIVAAVGGYHRVSRRYTHKESSTLSTDEHQLPFPTLDSRLTWYVHWLSVPILCYALILCAGYSLQRNDPMVGSRSQ
jgi:hypothetical protein